MNSLDLIIKQPLNDHLLLDVWIQMLSTPASKLSLLSFEMDDSDTPEKVLLMEQRSNRIMKNFDDVCNKQSGNLAMVILMCAFDNPESKPRQWSMKSSRTFL